MLFTAHLCILFEPLMLSGTCANCRGNLPELASWSLRSKFMGLASEGPKGTEMASSEMAPQALAPDFRALFESLPGLHLVLTPDMKIVAASEAYLRAMLAKREAIVGQPIFEVFPENSDEHAVAGIRNLRASLERVIMYKLPDAMDVQKFNVRAPNSDSGVSGVRYWIPVNSPILGADGEVAYIIHQVQDLTGFVGLPQGEPAPAEVHPEREPHAPPAEGGSPPRGHDVHEANWLLEQAYRELTKLSEELEVRVAERTAQLAEANAKLESELEERKQLEHHLLHSQKLEAVRRLAGGVSHDFNNLLTILQGYSELILTQSQAGTSQREQLEEITRASESAATLTRQLLAFSRQQLLDVRVIDLNEIVAEVEKILHRTIGEDIELATILDNGSCHIKADRGQIEQILLNLAVNARDALPKGGKLTIETSTVDLGAAYQETPGCRARALRRAGRLRHGRGHEPGDPGTHLRAILLYQAKGQRHGPGTFDGLRCHQTVRR